MKLILAILGVLTRKAVAVAIVLTALILATLVWNWVREQTRVMQGVEHARVEVATNLQEWRARKSALLMMEARLDALKAEEPSWLNPLEKLQWRARVTAAEAAVDAARTARDQAHAAWQEATAKMNRALSRVDTVWAGFLNAVRRTGWQLAGITLLVLAGPMLWKAFWFYGLAAIASHRPPARLSSSVQAGALVVTGRGKTIEVSVKPGRPLVARMDWVQQYSPTLTKRTRFLFEWRSPFTSYAAGLAEMTELAASADSETAIVLLNSGNDPHAHLLALELTDHPGVVLTPGAVVAVSGAIRLRPRWHLTSLHHWIAGRIRHILFCGTGTVYVTGHGGVDLAATEAPMVIEETLVLGYDSRAAFATVRTETFWPFFRDRTSLFDYRFDGGYAAIRQAAAPPAVRANANPFVRTVDAVFNALGRLLGL